MLALVLLILWPVAELFVVIRVADAIGWLWTLLLLIAGWPIGIWVLRSHGRAAWERLGAAVSAGRPPAREVLDGALILLGGVLLIIPGFITDVLGIIALLPPTRGLARLLLVRNLHSRVVVRAARFPGPSYDIESTAHDVDQPELPR
jgi:UPF0716 protein FxsA